MLYTDPRTGQTYNVSLEQRPDGSFRAVVNGRVYNLQAVLLPDGGWRLTLGDQRHTLYSAAQGDQRFVCLDGQHYMLTITEPRAARRARSTGGDLTAQMPGQVVNVLVREGEQVERGQTLVILEAMKMEIRVAAQQAGRIKRLLVETGAVVERGQVLVEIEPVAS
jgi:biotin carboxyl carrier protein